MIDTAALDQAVRRFPVMLALARATAEKPSEAFYPTHWTSAIQFEYRRILRKRADRDAWRDEVSRMHDAKQAIYRNCLIDSFRDAYSPLEGPL